MQDREIIDLLFERDERALSLLDVRYGALCRHISVGILADENDAEECVNDAYLGIWNSIPPARPDSLRAYVCTLVRRFSIKRYHHERAQKRNSTYDEALDELAGVLSDGNTVETALDAKELSAALELFLETLKKDDRVIFVRRYWFSESISEIAAHFDMSAHAVSVRLSRVREALRNFLMKRGMMA